MNKREAYAKGRDRGYEAVIYGEYDDDMDEDEIAEEAWEAEQNARQFSTFEFFAHDINMSRYPDGLWDEYERGVDVGIRKGIKELFRGR